MLDKFNEIHDLLATQEYDRALRLLYDQSSNRVKKEYRSDENHAWYIVGDIFFKLGKFDLAVNAFTKALSARPEDVDASMALANCYSELELFSKAEDALLHALKVRPNDSALRYNIANAYFDQGKLEQASTLYSGLDESCGEDVFVLAQKNLRLIKDAKK